METGGKRYYKLSKWFLLGMGITFFVLGLLKYVNVNTIYNNQTP